MKIKLSNIFQFPFSLESIKISTHLLSGGKRQKVKKIETKKLHILFFDIIYTKEKVIQKREHITRLKQAGLYNGKNKHRGKK